MPTYVAFLRAINLGAVRKFPKSDVVAAVQAAGGTDVETYLNTGNVRLTSTRRSPARVAEALEAAFQADRGFAVPTVVLTPAQLRDVGAFAAGLEHEGRHYVELLRDAPDADLAAELQAHGSYDVRVTPHALHLLVPPDAPHGGAALPTRLTKRLGVTTNRAATVVTHLASRWGA